MRDIMLDLETYGNTLGSKILSIGAVAFGPGGVAEDGFYVVVNRGGGRYGLHTDEGTRQWWNDQSPEARKVVEEAKIGGVPLPHALDLLDRYVEDYGGEQARVWGCGSDFDNALIRAAYRAVHVNREPAWKFWNNRCYRTLKSLFPMTAAAKRGGTHHHALDDARFQAEHAIALLQRIPAPGGWA